MRRLIRLDSHLPPIDISGVDYIGYPDGLTVYDIVPEEL